MECEQTRKQQRLCDDMQFVSFKINGVRSCQPYYWSVPYLTLVLATLMATMKTGGTERNSKKNCVRTVACSVTYPIPGEETATIS